MWFCVSVQVAISFISEGVKKLHHLVTALNTCYQYCLLKPLGSEHFLLELCMWLAPEGKFERKFFELVMLRCKVQKYLYYKNRSKNSIALTSEQ